MNANSLHKNHLRSSSKNLTRKGREEEPTASFYSMAMSIATDLSVDTDCLLDDWSPTDNTSEDLLSIHPPPLLQRQRSSSPRSVSDFWPMGFVAKDSKKLVDTGNANPNTNGNANGDDLTDCLDAPPLPLKSSLSTDLMNLMHQYFTNDLVRDILPKTTLTFYADREHKLDDFGIDEMYDEMQDSPKKMDSCFGKRKLFEDFPMQPSNGKEEDPLNFLDGTKPQAKVENTKATTGRDPSTDIPNTGTEKKTAATTKSAIRKKAPAKKKKAKRVPVKKFTTVKVVSGGKTLVSITAKLDAAKLNAAKYTTTKTFIPKRKTERKTLVSINAKLDAAMMNAMKDTATKKSIPKRKTEGKTIASIKAKLGAAKTNTTKDTTMTKSIPKLESEGKTLASIKAKLDAAKMKAAKDTVTTKSIPKRKTMPLVKKKITANMKSTTKKLKKIFNEAPTQPNEVDPPQRRTRHSLHLNWDSHYKVLKAFYDKNGHSNVLRSDPNKFLAGWVKRQRNNLKFGKLTSEQIELLNDLNFVWNMLENKWFQKFLLLQEYALKYKRTNVSAKDNRTLAEWTQRQRREYRLADSKLSAFRIEKLESLPNWTWIVTEKQSEAEQSEPEQSEAEQSEPEQSEPEPSKPKRSKPKRSKRRKK